LECDEKQGSPYSATSKVYMPIDVFFSQELKVKRGESNLKSVCCTQITEDKENDFGWQRKGVSDAMRFVLLFSYEGRIRLSSIRNFVEVLTGARNHADEMKFSTLVNILAVTCLNV